MNQIIFAEGRNDVHLLKKIAINHSTSIELIEFIGEDVVKNIGGEETRKVRNFTQKHNPYELLLKSDGGKPNLKHLISELIPELYNKDVKYSLLIDLDGGDFEGIKDDIVERWDSISIDLGMTIDECTFTNSHLTGYECSICLNSEPRDSFNVIGFNHSMETAASIDKRQDSIDDKKRKIHRLSQDRLVTEPVKNLFLS